MTRRDDFLQPVKDVLANRAGHQCSNPDCPIITSGPHSFSNKSVNIGVAAHIYAALPGGKRYDPDMTSEERKSIDNGIWLCQTCAKLVDSDDELFTVELLKSWKKQHEEAIHKNQLGLKLNLGSISYKSTTGVKSKNARLKPKISVIINSGLNNFPVYSHVSTSSSNPVPISFSIKNNSKTIIEYLQIHSWLLYGRVVRNPEVWESSPWKPQDIERLPAELTQFGNLGVFNRYTLSLSPHENFNIMPSQYPKYLPEFEIQWMTFFGMVPMPWQLEIPNMKPISGVLLLWVSERGIFSCESVPVDSDWNQVARRVKNIITKFRRDKSKIEYTGIP